jgi:hypothetical protein
MLPTFSRCALRRFLVAAFLVIPSVAFAQRVGAPEDAPRVFIDCPCDTEYVRTELTHVNYVRDRADADVHVLVTLQGTGGGGQSYVLNFIGQREFAGMTDSLTLVTPQGSTEDERRRQIVRYLNLGLTRYVARTSAADRLTITYAAPPPATGDATTPGTAPARDPWNFWVFRTGLNGSLSREKLSGSSSASSSLSATRTTEAWKIRVSANGRYAESNFTFQDGNTFTSYSNNYGGSFLAVRSMGPHASSGVTASVNSSTFLNQKLSTRVAPAFEYNIFPWAESTRRQLTAQYSIGYNTFDYLEETLFFRMDEQRLDHALNVGYQVTQPWGSAFVSVNGSQFLHDRSKYMLSAFGHGNFRLFRGFSLNLFGNASRINNQLHLPRSGATDEQVLLRQRQLATNYRIGGNIGISYTFGSIFNNVVNPRFGGGGGSAIFFDF